jgi:hypothetical protein
MLFEWIILFILILGFVIIIIFRNYLYHPNPSLYGTYSNPVYSICGPSATEPAPPPMANSSPPSLQNNNANECGQPGVLLVTRLCQPNLITGNGCINPTTGEQTFKSIVTTQTCTIECVNSKFVDTDIDSCKSYVDQNDVISWIYFPETDKVMPTLPVALSSNPPVCYDIFPNGYKRIQEVCTQIDPKGALNQCIYYNPRTGQTQSADVGFAFETFIPCANYPNQECGSWIPCNSYDLLSPLCNCISSQPGQLFSEQALSNSMICQISTTANCQNNSQNSDICTYNLSRQSTDCVQYDPTHSASTQCNLTQFNTNNSTICNNYSLSDIGNFIIGSDRRAFSTQKLPSIPSSIPSTMITLSPVICPNNNVQNPYCLNFCRVYLDQYNYTEPIKNAVKNRAGYLLQTNTQDVITAYLSTGPFANLPDANTVTPLDFREITIQPVNSPISCTNADTAGINGLVISLIPLSDSGLYKIAGTVKADIFGWLISGNTLRSFFPNSNKIYFQAEIDLLNIQICELNASTTPCTVNMPSDAQQTLINIRNHVQDNLNNWDNLIGSINDSSIYWVPAKNNLLRPSDAIGPVQSQIDSYAIILKNAATSTIPLSLPDIIMIGADQEPIINRTYKISALTNQVNSVNIIPLNENFILSLTLDFNKFNNQIIYNGQSTTIRDLFANRGSNQIPRPKCSA